MLKQRSSIYLMAIGLFAALQLGSAAVDQVLFMAVAALMLSMHILGHGEARLVTARARVR